MKGIYSNELEGIYSNEGEFTRMKGISTFYFLLYRKYVHCRYVCVHRYGSECIHYHQRLLTALK